MKKILVVISIIAVLALAFTGCSGKKESGGNSAVSGNSSENQSAQAGGNQNGSGWPPANILSQYGLTGTSAPSGVTDLMYSVYDSFGVVSLTILFKGTSSTPETIVNWFTGNGWVRDGVVDIVEGSYDKDNGYYRAHVSRTENEYIISFNAD